MRSNILYYILESDHVFGLNPGGKLLQHTYVYT
jgi:hypothetical protein